MQLAEYRYFKDWLRKYFQSRHSGRVLHHAVPVRDYGRLSGAASFSPERAAADRPKRQLGVGHPHMHRQRAELGVLRTS